MSAQQVALLSTDSLLSPATSLTKLDKQLQVRCGKKTCDLLVYKLFVFFKVTLLEALILEESFSSIVSNVRSDDGSVFAGLFDMPALDCDFGSAFLLLSSE